MVALTGEAMTSWLAIDRPIPAACCASDAGWLRVSSFWPLLFVEWELGGSGLALRWWLAGQRRW